VIPRALLRELHAHDLAYLKKKSYLDIRWSMWNGSRQCMDYNFIYVDRNVFTDVEYDKLSYGIIAYII
jgi:hypothetical protein